MAAQAQIADGTNELARRATAPDVVLDVPKLTVDEIALEVDHLHARVALEARLADLVQLHVGADADIANVALEIKGVEAEVHLTAHLENVVTIIARALDTVDQNPKLIVELARAVATAAEAAGGDLGDVGRLAQRVAPTPPMGTGAGDVGRAVATAEAAKAQERREESEGQDESEGQEESEDQEQAQSEGEDVAARADGEGRGSDGENETSEAEAGGGEASPGESAPRPAIAERG
jgi:hypothetical protein